MAKSKAILPTGLIKEFESLNINTEKMLGEMTKTGAETVEQNIKVNAPTGIKTEHQIMSKLKVSKTYKTPSDGGINTKVAFFYGDSSKDAYFINKEGEEVAIPMLLNAYEYGKSQPRKTKKGYNRGVFPKKPFLRKSFRKKQIESAMLKVQDKYIKGD